jgi:hypothetical protein
MNQNIYTIVPDTNWKMPFMLMSWAGYIALECWQNGGGSEKYTTHGKSTAAVFKVSLQFVAAELQTLLL